MISVLCLAIGFAALYVPLSAKIQTTQTELTQERRRQELSYQVDPLQSQVNRFSERIPRGTDTNEWVQYVIEGVRQDPLKLVNLDSDKPKRAGPFQAVVMNVQIEGWVADLSSLLEWLETDERLFRIDTARIEPARNNNDIRTMHITLLGLKG